jgi:hypothetical protein
MRKFLFLLLLTLPAHADDWSDADTVREAVYLGVLAVDWGLN